MAPAMEPRSGRGRMNQPQHPVSATFFHLEGIFAKQYKKNSPVTLASTIRPTFAVLIAFLKVYDEKFRKTKK